MAKIGDLFDRVGCAVEAVNEKRLNMESAKATFDAASQDLAKAEADLKSLGDELNAALGDVLKPSDPRVTVS